MSGKPATGRCPWPGTDPLYVAYHDDEWGVAERDDRALYEKLVLDGFQAGLSWITILRKREAFRRAFDGFAPKKVARYSKKKVEALMQDAGIVRNRMKIEGAVASARAWLEIMEKSAGFSPFLWEFVEICGGQADRQSLQDDERDPRRDGDLAHHLKGAQGAWVQILRADDHLRLHAGDWHGQRPPDLLPPPRGLRNTRPGAI
jgi:DNA-3-methyladenine glycosylase I